MYVYPINDDFTFLLHTYLHLTHYLEGVAETSQIFLRDTHILPIDLVMRNTADMSVVIPSLSDRSPSQV
jgi:hypothetical protein